MQVNSEVYIKNSNFMLTNYSFDKLVFTPVLHKKYFFPVLPIDRLFYLYFPVSQMWWFRSLLTHSYFALKHLGKIPENDRWQ